jgi:GMP synthase-like glutamine amidotransferase
MNDVSVMVLVVVDFGCPNTPQIVQVVQNFLKTVQIHVINPKSTCRVDFEENLKPVGIILSGGPDSVLSNSFRDMDSEIYDMDVPILGICYGAQLLVYHDDIEKKCLKKNYGAEFGYFEIDSGHGRSPKAAPGLEETSILFAGMKEKRMRVRMSHWDSIVSAPDGYKVTSWSSGPVSNVSEERDHAADARSSGTPRRVYTPPAGIPNGPKGLAPLARACTTLRVPSEVCTALVAVPRPSLYNHQGVPYPLWRTWREKDMLSSFTRKWAPPAS